MIVLLFLLLTSTPTTPPVYVSVDPFTSPQCDGTTFHDCIVLQGQGEPHPVLCPVKEVYEHCQKPAP